MPNYLNNRFPVNLLGDLDFGSADGHRDNLIEDTFIETQSIRTFKRDKHSIIVGPFGSGKSALFKMLKNQSKLLGSNFDGQLIIPIEEKVHFDKLDKVKSLFDENIDEENIYQLMWKFHATVRISTALADQDNFPRDSDEKLINKFLKVINSDDANESIVDKLSRLATSVSLQVDTKVGETPLHFKTKIANSKSDQLNSFNLDRVLSSANNVVLKRDFTRLTMIIDKVDKFVAGQSYSRQKKYIQGLLEIEDDFCRFTNLNFKIFLRKDLFSRLDYSALGPDKVGDNTIELKWSGEESLRFIANRIATALLNQNICTINDMLRSSDLSEYDLSPDEKKLLTNLSPRWLAFVFKFFSQSLEDSKGSNSKIERKIGLCNKFDRLIITKLFPRNINHINSLGEKESIDIFAFLITHFIDGNGACTPRYLLVFLKEVNDHADDYYENNPDDNCDIGYIDGDWEWPLFKVRSVEKAYIEAKAKYLKNITSIDSKWRNHIETIIQKKTNKTSFTLPWVKAEIGNLDDDDGIQLMAFLQVIGFFQVHKDHLDLRKRVYSLPILYKH